MPVFGVSLFAAAAFSLAFAGIARAEDTRDTQAARETKLQELKTSIFRYYKEPTDIARLLVDLDETGRARIEFVIGFLAGVFAKHPDTIESAKSLKLRRDTQSAIFQSLRLADRHYDAIAIARHWGWPLDQMTRIGPVTPLLQIKVEHRSTLDGLWGASFATGDEAYIRQIYDAYNAAASMAGVDVRDIIGIARLRGPRNRESLEAIRKKYAPDTFKAMAIASWAIVMLAESAQEHRFFAEALDRYTKAQPNSPAAQGLAEMRAAIARR